MIDMKLYFRYIIIQVQKRVSDKLTKMCMLKSVSMNAINSICYDYSSYGQYAGITNDFILWLLQVLNIGQNK